MISDRRLPGVGLLMLATMLILVVAIINAPAVTGRGSAEPPPPPPAVGDCLLSPGVVAPMGPNSPAVVLPAARIGPCNGERFGEVYAVVETAASLYGDVLTEGEPAVIGCPGGAEPSDYVSLALTGERGRWSPMVSVGTAVVSADDRQRAYGQHWQACIVTPGQGDRSYPGSVQAVGLTDSFPSVFAACSERPDRSDYLTPCSEPHRSEGLGRFGLYGPGPGEKALREGCATLAAERTGMPDITAGGALTLVMRASWFRPGGRSFSFGDSIGADWTGRAMCFLTTTDPDTLLTGSLVDLGSGPLPVAS